MFKKIVYTNEMEILFSEANLVCFSGTVLAAGVVADADGKKYVEAGSLIDADGNVVTATGDALTGTPVGILYQTVDVTAGDEAGSIMVEGYLRADRILASFSVAAQTAIKEALTEIKFR
ncbi:hypothetical protein [Clostridium lacusfryxellense]|uniref:hypothetical protein n=1 Tax=Clostridium lacusfryxellense TaxID=205328 RepID=UPI001C0B8DBD|nr:hypothetical protein [Clostridium lacusfryxellense]MBU3111997.1 hypothetical protein [Clostridium lacusfryxellense]